MTRNKRLEPAVTGYRVRALSSVMGSFMRVATLLCGAVCPTLSSSQELQVPASFSVYVSEESELYGFAPPHPCGRVLTLRSDVMPVNLEMFRVNWAAELSDSGEVLLRWPMPVDSTPVAVMNDRLTIGIVDSGAAVYLLPSGRIGLPLEGAWPPESWAMPKPAACPPSRDESLSWYFCVELSDQSDGRTRVIAYPPICT